MHEGLDGGENMARKDIHELIDWLAFTWDIKPLAPLLSGVRLRQGLWLGKMQGNGFGGCRRAVFPWVEIGPT